MKKKLFADAVGGIWVGFQQLNRLGSKFRWCALLRVVFAELSEFFGGSFEWLSWEMQLWF